MATLTTRFAPWRASGSQFEGRDVFEGFVEGYVTSRFAIEDGAHPDGHTGVDIGTFRRPVPVTMPCNARIDRIWRDGEGFGITFGNGLVFELEGGFWLMFAHLSRIAPDVHEGAPVQAGTVLGTTGSTGKSSGIHLHVGLAQPDNPNFNTFRGGGQPQGSSRFQGLLDFLDFTSAEGPHPVPTELSADAAQALQRELETAHAALGNAIALLAANRN